MKSLWPTKKLGEICEIIAGQAPPSKYYNDEGKGIPFLTVNSFGNIYPKVERWTTKCLRESKEGDVLFSVAGSLGLVNLGINACITRSIFALRPLKSFVLQKFLFYTLKKYGSQIALMGSGTAQKVITINQLSKFEIPLPPIPVQQKIVKILDTIQSAVEIQEKIIEKTKEFKKSLMNLLFHYGLVGLRIKELMGSRVGELTSSEIEKLGLKLKKTNYWPTKKLGEICEERKEKNIKNLNLPVYAVSNIFGFVLSEEFFSKRVYSESLRNYKLVYKHDFAYNPARVNVGSLGLFKKDSPGLISPMYIVFYIKDKNILDPHFLFYLLKTNLYQNKIKNLAASRGSIRQTLKLEDLLELEIPLPPLPEQQEIAEILQTIDQKIEIEKKKKELYEELFKSMLNKVMNQEIDIEKIEI